MNIQIALCQINTKIGAFEENVNKICVFSSKAAELGADIAIFPELSISSYPPLDLLDRPDFLDANQKALNKLVDLLKNNAPKLVVLGSIIQNASTAGRAIYNAAVTISNGRIVHAQPKRLLPTYDVFDESRYFEPGNKTTLYDSPLGKLGLSVCEDAWFAEERTGVLAGRQLYQQDPATELAGANLVINVSASPFEMNKRTRRMQLLSDFIRKTKAMGIYVNQVGANDEILFDGSSLVFSADGTIAWGLPSFCEALGLVEIPLGAGSQPTSTSDTPLDGSIYKFIESSSQPWQKQEKLEQPVHSLQPTNEISIVHQGLVTGIQEYFKKTKFTQAVIGLSGGIDSAVVCALASEALGPKNVSGVSLPSIYSSSHSLTDAEKLAKNIGCRYSVVSLKFLFKTILMELKNVFGSNANPLEVTEENIQARLRAIILLAIANKQNALVLSTGNKSEYAVGYCTIYGDMAGALAPIGDLYKTKVYELAQYIQSKTNWIPKDVFTKPPSAELRPNQTDQDTLPPYELLDNLLERYFEGLESEELLLKDTKLEKAVVQQILVMIRRSEFKRRQAAPVLKVTSKAFGMGRRVPIAKTF